MTLPATYMSPGGIGAPQLPPLTGTPYDPNGSAQGRNWKAEELKLRNKLMLAKLMLETQGAQNPSPLSALAAAIRGYTGGKALREGMRGEEKLADERQTYERQKLAELEKLTGLTGYSSLADLSPEMQPLALAMLTPKYETVAPGSTLVDTRKNEVVVQGTGRTPAQRTRKIDDWTTQQEEWVGGEWVPVGPPTKSPGRFKQVVTVDENGNAQIGYVDLSTMGGAESGGEGGSPSVVNVGERPGVTSGETRAARAFLGRMRAAEQKLRDHAEMYPDFNPASVIEGARGTFNITATPEYRQYRQAANDWIRAKLRKESGAAIGTQEMQEEFETYFPQPGDDPGTIAAKAESRRQAEIQLETQGGIKPDQSVQTEVPPDSAPIELPPGVTAEDVMFTAEKHGMTPQQVVQRLWEQRRAP